MTKALVLRSRIAETLGAAQLSQTVRKPTKLGKSEGTSAPPFPYWDFVKWLNEKLRGLKSVDGRDPSYVKVTVRFTEWRLVEVKESVKKLITPRTFEFPCSRQDRVHCQVDSLPRFYVRES